MEERSETKLCPSLSLSLSPFVRRDFETGNAIPGLIRASTIPSRKILANLVQI